MANNKAYDFKTKVKEFNEQLEKKLEDQLKVASFIIHGQVLRDLAGQKSGFEYPVPGTGKVVDMEKTLPNGRKFYYRKLVGATMYTASAPGEAPAVRTGDLRTDYKAKVVGRGMKAEGQVGSNLEYAPWLEKGTANMHPRPHLLPAMKKSKSKVLKAFEGMI
jgi:hypothetical protein